jgi:guanylate kinase
MGKVLIFSGPSGVGKGTIIDYIRSSNPESFDDIITATSRKPRENKGVMECDGVDYHFFTPDQFRDQIAAGYFAEYEEVYPGKFYGTPIDSIKTIFNSQKHGTMDIDYKGALNLKHQFPDDITLIFVKSKDIEQLRERLLERNPNISESEMDVRLARAREEFSSSTEFDHIIVNDVWSETEIQLSKLIKELLAIEHESIIHPEFKKGLS